MSALLNMSSDFYPRHKIARRPYMIWSLGPEDMEHESSDLNVISDPSSTENLAAEALDFSSHGCFERPHKHTQPLS